MLLNVFVFKVKTLLRALFQLYFTATNFDVRPISELIILALAIAIERLFFAPLSRNATPSLTLLVGFADFFIICIYPFRLNVFLTTFKLSGYFKFSLVF